MSAVQLVKHWTWRLYHVDENSKAADIGLLILRVAVGLCLFYHHGAEKFYDFHTLAQRPYLDPIGIGVVPSVIFAGLTDGICSLLVLIGLFSRYASFLLLICLNTVWWLINHGLQRMLGQPVAGPGGTRPQQMGSAGAQHVGQMGAQIGQQAAQMGQHAAQMGQHAAQAAQAAAPHFARVVHTIPTYMNVPLYLLAYLVIFIAGPGRYSLDKKLEARMHKKAAAAATVSAH